MIQAALFLVIQTLSMVIGFLLTLAFEFPFFTLEKIVPFLRPPQKKNNKQRKHVETKSDAEIPNISVVLETVTQEPPTYASYINGTYLQNETINVRL